MMKRLISFLLAVGIILSMLILPFSAYAAGDSETVRAIAIVFDNSGSMYLGTNASKMAWCRATYAMEAFATMMNMGDTMLIYPMHPIEVGGSEYSSDNPLRVTQQNASVIREIYTPEPYGTPIETITTACEGLVNTKADEKWLIVLTDGDEFSRNGGSLGGQTEAELEKELTSCVSKVNVMYLGIGQKSVIPDESDVSGAYAYIAEQAGDSSEVLSKLTDMCNTIFGRDVLTIGTQSVEFDVSMGKLIIFLQGSGIENISLSSQSYTDIDTLKYSEKGGGGQGNGFLIDDSLQGVMVTYEDLDAGTYSLSYSGNATSVTAYYEPDVDLEATLKDAQGNPVDPNGTLTEGTYTIDYTIVDKHGEPVNSELLGQTDYKITYWINDQEYVVEKNEAGKIELTLEQNDVLDAKFEVTYLDGYVIRRSSAELGWPLGGFRFAAPPAGELSVELIGTTDEYKLTEISDEAMYRVKFYYEGTVLSGTQLDNLKTSSTLEGGNAVHALKRDAEGYYVSVSGYDPPSETQTGEYTLTVSGVYTNEDGLDTNTATASAVFEIIDNSGALAMTLEVPQDYYLISELAEGKPIRVCLTLNGLPLTDEQLSQVELTYKSEGLVLLQEPVWGESAFDVRIDPESSPESDSYTIQFTARTKNEIGRDVSDSASAEVDVRTMPLWLRILLPILIILAIIALIVFIMTRKVLPKKLRMVDVEFYVDGDTVDSGPNAIRFSGGGKRKGSFTVSSPSFPDMRANVGIKVTVEAVSPRYVRSTRRKMRVLNISPTIRDGVRSYTLGGMAYDEDPLSGKYVAAGAMEDDPFAPFNISSDTDVNIMKSLDDGFSVNFDCKIVTAK